MEISDHRPVTLATVPAIVAGLVICLVTVHMIPVRSSWGRNLASFMYIATYNNLNPLLRFS